MLVVTATPRDGLARHIAGEITLSDDPGAMFRKWRTGFDIFQTALAEQLDVSPSVVSGYESGHRRGPGIGVIRRMVEALLDIDEARGGGRIRQYARAPSTGLESDIVQGLQKYPMPVLLSSFYDAIGATPTVDGDRDRISGHTIINSIQAITRLSSKEFYRLYRQSTDRALVFTDVTCGESSFIAMRVATPTPDAIVLHGFSKDDFWEHTPTLATVDGFALAVTNRDLDKMPEDLRKFP